MGIITKRIIFFDTHNCNANNEEGVELALDQFVALRQ
jgi:hypothetical protein